MSRLHVTASAICGNSTFATSQNAAPATTSRKATSQSAAPATKKQRACIDTLPKYCACHAKHENDLTFCDLGAPKRAFRARLPPLFILWKTGWCRSANVPPNGSELTSWRRVGDDEATTRRRRGDDDTTNATRTQVQPQTPTINGNPSLRIREKYICVRSWTWLPLPSGGIFEKFLPKRPGTLMPTPPRKWGTKKGASFSTASTNPNSPTRKQIWGTRSLGSSASWQGGRFFPHHCLQDLPVPKTLLQKSIGDLGNLPGWDLFLCSYLFGNGRFK